MVARMARPRLNEKQEEVAENLHQWRGRRGRWARRRVQPDPHETGSARPQMYEKQEKAAVENLR